MEYYRKGDFFDNSFSFIVRGMKIIYMECTLQYMVTEGIDINPIIKSGVVNGKYLVVC